MIVECSWRKALQTSIVMSKNLLAVGFGFRVFSLNAWFTSVQSVLATLPSSPFRKSKVCTLLKDISSHFYKGHKFALF